jgi:antitoxin MazE
MKTQIGRWGNSLAIRIPKYIADELALTVNGEVDCRLENGVLIIQPLHQLGKYSHLSNHVLNQLSKSLNARFT